MIIGISGKKQAGKDTIGKIIQYLIANKYNKLASFRECSEIWGKEEEHNPNCGTNWQIKWFAEPLKDIVCILLGCTREQLEDNEFKERELGEEWNRYLVKTPIFEDCNILGYNYYYFATEQEAKDFMPTTIDGRGLDNFEAEYVGLEKLTPRKLLQLIGTECGRQIIHPNIWVNALMSQYKLERMHPIGDLHPRADKFPNWIITDVRFLNEVKAIKDRKGVIIRVNRPPKTSLSWSGLEDKHESEISLDNYKDFDFVITNDRDTDKLIEQVRSILYDLKILS